LKNTGMSLPDKFIVFLGRTFSGHNHDYIMLKQEFRAIRWLKESLNSRASRKASTL
jgi:hypothetical protein